MKPFKLSLIIPTYDRLHLLESAIESFVGQFSYSYEAILVDDGSSDGTREYLRTLDKPFTVLLQEHKGGSAARNRGLSEAKGHYVKYLDDDDLLAPDMVERQVEYLSRHPEVDICYSDWGVLDTQVGKEQYRKAEPDLPIIPALLNDWWCANFSYMIRRSVAQSIRWDESLSSLQDFDYFLRLALNGATFGYLPGHVGWYRRHSPDSVARTNRRQHLENELAVLRMAQDRLIASGRLTPAIQDILARRYFRIAEHFYRLDRDWRMFERLLQDVLDLSPGFVPDDRPNFRLAVRLLGYKAAEWLSTVIRQIYDSR